MIYLYVKIHNVTGLKYLGKTTNKNPHKYPGSGKHWLRHIKKHGYDVTTQILIKTTCEDVLKLFGTHYSKLWNVVNSKEWANLKPENGDGGGCFGEFNGAYGKPKSKEHREKLSKANKGKQTGKNNGFYGKKHLPEIRSKIILGRKNHIMTEIELENRKSGAVKMWERRKKCNLPKPPVSEETRKKLSEQAKRVWAKRRLQKELQNETSLFKMQD